MPPLFSRYQLQILIHCRTAQITNPCQFTYIHIPRSKSRIMLVEHSGNIILCCLRSANFSSASSRIRHSRFYPSPNHRQFQLTEHASHLKERFAHRICLPVPAINRDASHNNQPQSLVPDDVYDLVQLLCASAQSADFHRDNSIWICLIRITA